MCKINSPQHRTASWDPARADQTAGHNSVRLMAGSLVSILC